jgi:pyruvate dehydrogenase E1 component beta subunit
MTRITLAKGLNMGLRTAMEDDPKVLLMGEDVGKLGGVFRITDGLQKDFGEDRVIDSPLAESGILGTAVGLAMRGYRPVCEIQFDGFVYPAYDQIVSQVAKTHFRSQGKVRMPMVIRIPFGGGIGAVEHHSESPEAYFSHTPGLKVVSCSSAVDAYQMIQQSISSDDPSSHLERGWLVVGLGQNLGQGRIGEAGSFGLSQQVGGQGVQGIAAQFSLEFGDLGQLIDKPGIVAGQAGDILNRMAIQ